MGRNREKESFLPLRSCWCNTRGQGKEGQGANQFRTSDVSRFSTSSPSTDKVNKMRSREPPFAPRPLEQKNHYPKKTITWIQGNFPRSWSKGDVPFRRCQKICRRVNAGTQPHCEHTPWMSLFCEVGGWISEGIRQTTWLENGEFFRWKMFTSFPAAERNTQTIFRWKMEPIFRWKVKIFRTPPWRLS